MKRTTKTAWFVAPGIALAVATGSAQGPRKVALGDWPEARGPNRDGVSRETGLIDKWAAGGENFLWRAPFRPSSWGITCMFRTRPGAARRCRNG